MWDYISSKPAIGIFDVDGAFDSHTLPPTLLASLLRLGLNHFPKINSRGGLAQDFACRLPLRSRLQNGSSSTRTRFRQPSSRGSFDGRRNNTFYH